MFINNCSQNYIVNKDRTLKLILTYLKVNN